jgi:catechol 2,3-dioxygenase-like lactoylglutathione lyase family enzyme
MIDHLSFAVSDLAAAGAFYDDVLAALGYVRVWTARGRVPRPGLTGEGLSSLYEHRPDRLAPSSAVASNSDRCLNGG